MYEEIEIDGEIIKIRTKITEEETGVLIKKDKLEDVFFRDKGEFIRITKNNDLEDTLDFSKELEELSNETSEN